MTCGTADRPDGAASGRGGTPVWLGMPIDHILTTSGWSARSFTVITDEDHSGAPHRPVFAVLTRRAQGVPPLVPGG